MAVLPTPGSPISTGLREVPRVLLERLEFPLRIAVGHALVAAHGRQRGEELFMAQPDPVEHPLDVLVGLRGREEDVLGRDVIVLERLRLVLCLLEHGERAA
jgi:hypothetical protein